MKSLILSGVLLLTVFALGQNSGADSNQAPVLIGDVNLNGIAYEGADIIGCLNGLFHGTEYYTIDPEQQLMATDANEDGIYPTVEDYQYFLAVGQGRFNPGDPIRDPIDGHFIHSSCDGSLLVSSVFEYYEGGAVYLNYLAPTTTPTDITVVEDILYWRANYSIVGDTVKIIFHSFEGIPIPPEETDLFVLTYDGDPPELLFVTAAGFDAQKVNVSNWQRGDADGDGEVILADAVFIIDFIFTGGPPPDSFYAADANRDGVVNLADAVYTIFYIFKGGPAPGCE